MSSKNFNNKWKWSCKICKMNNKDFIKKDYNNNNKCLSI